MNQPGFNGMSCVFDHCLHHDAHFPQEDDYSGEFRDSFISQYFSDPRIFTIFFGFHGIFDEGFIDQRFIMHLVSLKEKIPPF